MFELGQEIIINNAEIFPRFSSKKSDIRKTGIFYIWNNSIKNRRIRITNNNENVSIPGRCIGWVNINSIIQ